MTELKTLSDNLPEGYLFIAMMPDPDGEGFQVGIYNKIEPFNPEIVCLARGLVEILSTSTDGVLFVGQTVINRENTPTEETTVIETGTTPVVTKSMSIVDLEPVGKA